MKIAIVGSGISGLTAAYLLNRKHEIVLFEKDDYIGGHTHTHDIEQNGEVYPVDTGFIVHNDKTYPNFIKLMAELGVTRIPTEMSFGVKSEVSGLEYCGTNLNHVFAQRTNILNRSFLKMLKEILRFNKEVTRQYEEQTLPEDLTLGEYLKSNGYTDYFTNHYAIPMGAAIWSIGTEQMMQFPMMFFTRFFHNHGLLTVTDQPQWYVLQGGSKAYIEPITKGFIENIRLNSEVTSIRRYEDHVQVGFNGKEETFDHVVIAAHSNQALAMLESPTDAEKEILGAVPYEPNEAILHQDKTPMPKKKLAWASWNYRLRKGQENRPTLTYDMNNLQRLTADPAFFVTLNQTDLIQEEKVIGRYQYEHPVYLKEGEKAQQRFKEVSGSNRTHYCGAYWFNGFHEDGVVSGLRVAEFFGETL